MSAAPGPLLAVLGKRYFVDGRGGSDDNSGLAEDSAWKSLERVVRAQTDGTIQPGDGVFFQRGQQFDGELKVTRAGSAGRPISFGAYGSGAKPVFNGLTRLVNWSSVGNGVWEADCAACVSSLNLVTLNGAVQAMGRFPNIGAPNGGYLIYESHTWDKVYENWPWTGPPLNITDSHLAGGPDWTGAEVVIRMNHWNISRGRITRHSGSTITYEHVGPNPPNDGYGYFIQNDPRTLDVLGEWYFNPTTRKLRMFFGSAGPGTAEIKASVLDRFVLLDAKPYITFDNLAFIGANKVAFDIRSGSSNLQLQNCDFDYSGLDGISSTGSDSLTLESLSIDHTGSTAIDLRQPTANSVIRNSSIKNTGTIPGMGGSGNDSYNGINTSGPNNVMEGNVILNTGSTPMAFIGENALAKNNFIDTYAFAKDDAGGMNTWGAQDRGKRIIGNIILNGLGAMAGTPDKLNTGVNGIYLDTNTANVEISGNTVAHVSRDGLIVHNSHDIKIDGNTFFDNFIQLDIIHDVIDGGQYVTRNVVATNNVLVAKTVSQKVLEVSTVKNDIGSIGSFDRNIYARPLSPGGVIHTGQPGGGGWLDTNLSLENWQAMYGFDTNSRPSTAVLPEFTVTSVVGTNLFGDGSFNTSNPNVFCMADSCKLGWSASGRLDGGALQVANDPAVGSSKVFGLYVQAGGVTAGKNYRVRFSAITSGAKKTVQAFAMNHGGAYEQLSPASRVFDIGSARGEYEFVFTPSISTAGTLVAFGLQDLNAPFWIDNFELIEVLGAPTNPDDVMRLEYNATLASKTNALPGNFVDMKGNLYAGSITLAPFTSAVLMKVAGGSFSSTVAVSLDQLEAQLWTVTNSVHAACAATPGCDYANYGQHVSINGKPAYLNYGWLDAGDILGTEEIDAWVNYSGFTASLPDAGRTRFTLDGARDPANCSVTYADAYYRRQINNVDGVAVTKVSTGC